MSEGDPRRRLPSVDALLDRPEVEPWLDRYGRSPVRSALREALELGRSAPPAGEEEEIARALLESAEDILSRMFRPSLRPVLNGTGVVLHTNLGRAVLAPEAIAAQRRAAGYGNVELDLASGSRGSRYDHCVSLLRELTGAEEALVVNNNAAAVALVVNEFANGTEVVVSRGELVEIGGSFRMPDVVTRSGGILREVGTTNRTRIEDYEGAARGAGLLLRVHPSNYRVEGFAERPRLEDLVGLARRAAVPLAHDVGSGLLCPELLPGFPYEPTVMGSVAAGTGLVTFSGDKLLGGPQAGLIVGRAELVRRLRRNPLLRAFRVDKTTLAALEATLSLHRDPAVAATRIPTIRMLRESAEGVRSRAREAAEAVPAAPPAGVEWSTEATRAVVGGGSFPGFELESAGWIISGLDADMLAGACRAADPALIGRIEEGCFVVDMRTIPPGDEPLAAAILAAAVDEAWGGSAGRPGAEGSLDSAPGERG